MKSLCQTRKKRQVIHINNCKLWHPVDESVLRIVAAAEEEDELEKDKTKLAGDILTTIQRETPNNVLENFKDVLKDVPR